MSFNKILSLKPSGSFCISGEKKNSLIYLFYISTEIKKLQVSVFNYCGIIFILYFSFLSASITSSAGDAANPEVCGQAMKKEKICHRRKTSAE